MGHEFELRKEIDLPAAPEQVWDAIATGPGIDSWFMGHNEVEPGEDGRTRQTMLGHTSEAAVTAWEPARRLAFRTDEDEDGRFMALEYLIEGRDKASTVLRLVQSGVLGDDWETEYEAMKTGWDMYLQTLAAYLAYFPGRTATPVTAIRPQTAGSDEAWAVLTRELGLPAVITEGVAVHLTPAGLPPIDGVIDCAGLPHFLGVRADDGFYRFIHSGDERGKVLVLGHHLFADTDPEKTERAWQDWLTGLSFS